MKKTTIILFFLFSLIIVFFSFKEKEESTILKLDNNNYIQPIIDNEGTKEAFIRTLKVHYKDLNTRVKTRPSDTTYYRCAFKTSIIFYSVFDSLKLVSESRKSCEINAFFNLSDDEYKWLRVNSFYFVKITNENTRYQIIHDIPLKENQRKLQVLFYHYNKLKD